MICLTHLWAFYKVILPIRMPIKTTSCDRDSTDYARIGSLFQLLVVGEYSSLTVRAYKHGMNWALFSIRDEAVGISPRKSFQTKR